ncbi:MAG: hypothetical protein H6706_29880 [Myxococcales bacterium]|nr:hypothetical protein [Myxococcales bacterium]
MALRGVVGVLLIGVAIGGCDDGPSGGGGVDAGGGDGAPGDARAADATPADGALVDAAPVDAAPVDARVPVERPPAPANEGIYAFAHGCVTMDVATFGDADIRFIRAAGETFAFDGADATEAARFRLQPTDLGTFLLYDAERRYLTAETSEAGEVTFPRVDHLESDISLVDDSYRSTGEWTLEVSAHDPTRFQLRQYATGRLLTVGGLDDALDDAAIVTLYPSEGCADFPELTIDAAGSPGVTTWPDGDVYGIVETHGHLLTNFAFGGGGIFHGAPFHRLGVEHALASCEPFHEADGRRDVVGYALDGDLDPEGLIASLAQGRAPEFSHHADGYPTFTDWPNTWNSLTHQAMYYRWLERAWLGGLRLFVQHATGNSVLCELVTGAGWQRVRYDCNDMVSVDRQIAEARNMERYIDAQAGGPGKGFFRIVESPAEARAVIAEGKLAVLLGIEISNVFDCFVTPREGFPTCTPELLREKLDRYHGLGVRAVFPVHKYDNGFSAGDGHRGIIEIGNLINSGHWSNFTLDCPGVPITFDKGDVQFGGANQPREDYLSPPPNDTSRFVNNPIATLLPFAGTLQEPPLRGAYCQNAGLTALGETLLEELMDRGMIVEVDHLPQRSAERAYALLGERAYPPAATHGNNKGGLTYALGGISNGSLGRCADAADPQAMVRGLLGRVGLIAAQGGYPAEGFGFDLNGLAHGPRPRFGDDARCGQPQENPVQYPFTSVAGDVTFTEPRLGEKDVDFNTQGMLHIGLLPELIEDARRGGATDADLEPLFRSAEGYLRMWELAERRGRGE